MNIMHTMKPSRGQTRSADGTIIAFECFGTGIPIVCLHGFSDSRECWIEAGYVEPLVAAGFQVILIDSRGHGASGKPHHPTSYVGALRVADLVAVLVDLGLPKAMLLGHSMGGVLALAAVAMLPQRILSAAVIGADPFAAELGHIRRLLDSGKSPWIEHLEQEIGCVSDWARRRIEANDIRALRACVSRDRLDFSHALQHNRVPILALAGEYDERKAQVEAMRRLRKVTVKVMPERNHVTAFSDPAETLNLLLDFFQSQRA